MAKNVQTESASETPFDEAVAPVAAVEPKKAGATPRIMVTLEDGTTKSRQDYIREQFAAGVKRGDIARKLTELTGAKVAYQVVFAATKTAPKPAETAPVVEAAPIEAVAAGQPTE